MFNRLLYGLSLAYLCGFVIAQGVVVDLQPIEIFCDGSIISTTTRTTSRSITASTVSGITSDRTFYSTTTTTGISTVPYTVIGTPGFSGGIVPVTVYTPPSSRSPDPTTYATTTTVGSSTVPYTVTGTPKTFGGTVPVTVYTPSPSSTTMLPTSNASSFRSPALSTTTVTTTGITTPVTFTGTPSTPGGITPVTVLTVEIPSTSPTLSTSSSTTCSVPTGSTTVSASRMTLGASTTFTVPACATLMRFVVSGGNGENFNDGPVGFGGLVAGSLAVQPGDLITAIAGGSAFKSTGGQSVASSGGSSSTNTNYHGGGGGGGASQLEVNHDLIAVAGGGGGIGGYGEHWVAQKHHYLYNRTGNDTGDAGQPGNAMHAIDSAGIAVSTAGGGQPGTLTSPGFGSTSSGSYTSTRDGLAGQGSAGANGLSTNTIASGLERGISSGSGGGGYRAGGSGSILYWDRGNNDYITLGGDGGGGSNYVSSAVSGASTGTTFKYVGRVIVSFS